MHQTIIRYPVLYSEYVKKTIFTLDISQKTGLSSVSAGS